MPCQRGCLIVGSVTVDAVSYASLTGNRNGQPVAIFYLERNREPSRPLESSAMRTWITKQLRILEDWDHPEPDQQLFEDCGGIVREAARRAASAGLLDHYQKHKRTRHCTSQDAKAVLSSILAALQPEPDFLTPPQAAKLLGTNPDKIRSLIRSGRLPAVDTSTSVRPRWKIKRTDVDALRRTATPPTTRHRPRDTEETFF